MTTTDSLLRAILDAPEDDTLRLITADWLDDHGEPDRAEFIRLSIEWENMTHGCTVVLKTRCDGSKDQWCLACRKLKRAQQLFSTDWLPDFGGQLRQWWFGEPATTMTIDRPFAYGIRRGFVDEVRLSLDDWLAHGREIVAAAPVTRVVTDREPGEAWWWWRDGDGTYAANRAYIPSALFDELDRPNIQGANGAHFDTREAALDALSAACLALARQEAPR